MSVFLVQRRTLGEVKPKHLRQQGVLPMALVERTHETTLIQAPVHLLREAIQHADGLGRLSVQIEGEKKPRKAMVKKIEHDALKHQLIHVTLQEVSEDDEVKVDIAVHAVGTPTILETEEGILMQSTDHVKIKGKMSSLPERIDIDVTNMLIGEHISASEIELPEGVELLTSGEATLFSLKPPIVVVETTVEEGAEGEEAAAEEGTSEETSAPESEDS